MPSRVNRKGQVIIPKPLRERLGLRPGTRVEFRIADDGRVFLARTDAAAPGAEAKADPGRFARLRGTATVKMTTDQIMRLTRGER